MRFACIVAVAFATFTGAACKGDREKCEQAARNFATLTYWERVNKEIAERPAAERDGLRKKKVSEFTNELETKIDTVVSQCQSANNEEQVDCMIAAKTAKDALDCADMVPND